MIKYIPIFQRFVLFAVIVFIVPATVLASAVQLTTGKIIEGIIVERTDELIKIESGLGIPITYYLDEIESIDGDLVGESQSEPQEPTEPIDEEIFSGEDAIQLLEPINVIELIQTDEDDGLKEVPPRIKAEPAKDIQVIEESSQVKESPSPFGPKIKKKKPKKTNNEFSPGGHQEHYLLGKIATDLKSENPPVVKKPKKVRNENSLFRAINSFIEYEYNVFIKQKTRLQNELPLIREKLEQVPLKIRKDILIVSGLFLAIVYILGSFPLMKIAQKLKYKNIWLAWVPVVQVFYLNHMAKGPFLWYIYLLIPVLNIFTVIYIFAALLKVMQKSRWLVLLILIPGINIFTLWYLALTKAHQDMD